MTSPKNRITAGDIGFAYLIRALSQGDRGDVIYSMLKQSAEPGYLYQIGFATRVKRHSAAIAWAHLSRNTVRDLLGITRALYASRCAAGATPDELA